MGHNKRSPGKAFEWLGASGCRSVFESLVSVDSRKSRGSESRLWACCPLHNEDTPSFVYMPDEDRYHCYGCGESGDLITLFSRLNGLDSSNGFRAFRERFAPDARLDRGARPMAPLAPAAPRPWQPKPAEQCPENWSDKAESFVRHSQDRLAANPEVLAWLLAERGITAETAKACRLGWNDKNKYPSRTSWGLPKEIKPDGKELKLWLPEGLIIPWGSDGKITRIKIRRPNIQKKGELKYYLVPGSSPTMSVYGKRDARVILALEAELDAVLLWQEVRNLGVTVMAGPTSSRPNVEETAMLSQAEVIVLAFNFGKMEADGTFKLDESGVKCSQWWLDEFPAAIRRPIPPRFGKDPGEGVKAGLDMREWMLAALPYHIVRDIDPARPVPAKPVESAPAPEAAPSLEPKAVPTLESARETLPDWVRALEPGEIEFFGQDVRDLVQLMAANYAAPVLVPHGSETLMALQASQASPEALERIRRALFGPCLLGVLALADPWRVPTWRGLAGLHGAKASDGQWAVAVKREDDGLVFDAWALMPDEERRDG